MLFWSLGYHMIYLKTEGCLTLGCSFQACAVLKVTCVSYKVQINQIAITNHDEEALDRSVRHEADTLCCHHNNKK